MRVEEERLLGLRGRQPVNWRIAHDLGGMLYAGCSMLGDLSLSVGLLTGQDFVAILCRAPKTERLKL